jgi:hypothetical protein
VSALAEALVAAQAELPCALGKDADGQIGQRSYRYLTLDALISATRPILTQHGLTIMQWPTYIARGEDAALPALATRLSHSTADVHVSLYPGALDGITMSESVEYVMPLYLSEKTMQGLGAAITYARRYAWQSVLGIAAEEDTGGPAPTPEEDIPF